MRENTLKRWVLAACAFALAAPALSGAAGLGRLTVISSLGQPLNAEVELLSVQKGETLSARLSSVDTYQRASLPYNSGLVGTRVTVERRPNGATYLKVTTPRPINEPFAELLIEINSEHGRVTRQYTVLLDPPGYGRAAGELPPPAVAAPAVRPPAVSAEAAPPAAAAPGAPLAGAPGPAAAPPPVPRAPRQTGRSAARALAEPSAAGARQYGPVKAGETLGKIAKSVQPEGVSLEQTLVGLYRQNPDAFIKKNMNLVKSGRILTVPEASEMGAVAQREAVKEVRLQVADFNSFRGSLAERAGAAPEDGSVSSGRIGARVAKGGTAEPRDTVRLSRGDAKGAAKGSAAERVRALEEEAVAREKTLADANTRISQLEKTIQDMKRLAEMKSAAPADKAGAVAPPPAVKGQAPGAVATAPVIPAPPAKAPEPAQVAKGAAPAKAPDMVATGPEPMKAPPDVAKAPEAKGAAETAKAPEPKDDLPPPKPKAPAPPAAAVATQPDLMDTILDEPLYLVAGGGVVVLGLLGFVAARRRRGSAQTPGRSSSDLAPDIDSRASRGASAAANATVVEPGGKGSPTPSPSPEDNDLDFNANARSAAARGEPAPRAEPPRRAEPAPPPKASEPARPAYKAPEPAPRPEAPTRTEPVMRAEPPKREPPPSPREDLTRAPEPAARPAAPAAPKPSASSLSAARSLEGGSSGASAARPADIGTQRPVDVPPAAIPPKVDSTPLPDLPDFSLEVPPAGGDRGLDSRPAPAPADFNMDFNLEPLPPIEVPGETRPAGAAPSQSQSQGQANDLEFKLDDISLDFGTKAPAGGAGAKAGKDDHWYDVQQKFDLAKAYEEMGDKDGARDILKEVVKEGDTEQQAQAKKLLASLT